MFILITCNIKLISILFSLLFSNNNILLHNDHNDDDADDDDDIIMIGKIMIYLLK